MIFHVFLSLFIFIVPSHSNFFEINHYDYLYGVPFIDVILGDPPKAQFVLFDTGSFITFFACSTNPIESESLGEIFIPIQSSTFDYVYCSHDQCRCDSDKNCLHSCQNFIQYPELNKLFSPKPPKTSTPNPQNNYISKPDSFYQNNFKNVTDINNSEQNTEHSNTENTITTDLTHVEIDTEPSDPINYLRSTINNETKNLLETAKFIGTGKLFETRKLFETAVSPVPVDNSPVLEYPHHQLRYNTHLRNLYNEELAALTEISDVCFGEIIYIDGSNASGPFFSDAVAISDFSNPSKVYNYEMFICDFSHNTEYNGILGAGKTTNIIDYMIIEQFLLLAELPNFIGICSSDENFGGSITFGGYNPNYFIDDSAISWFPLYDERFYIFRVAKVSSFNSNIENNWQFIYDSGSTRSIFPEEVALLLEKEIFEHVAMGDFTLANNPNEIIINSNPFPVLSNISLYDLNDNLILTIDKNSLFRDIGGNQWMANWTYRPQNDVFVLGSLMTRNTYVLLDNDKNRIAFQPANCPKHFLEERVLTQQFELTHFENTLSKPQGSIAWIAIGLGCAIGLMVLLAILVLIIRRLKENNGSFFRRQPIDNFS